MLKKNIIRRYILFLTGLFIASMGVAFSTKAGLGTSPVASVPYSVSLVFPIFILGGWFNILSILHNNSGSIIKCYNGIFDKVKR